MFNKVNTQVAHKKRWLFKQPGAEKDKPERYHRVDSFLCLCWDIRGLDKEFWKYRRPRFDPWVRKIPWRRKWLPTPVFWAGEIHGQRSLMGYGPWGLKKSDMTKLLSLSPSFKKSFIYLSFVWLHPVLVVACGI